MPTSGRTAFLLVWTLPLMLGGVMSLDHDLDRRWTWCGAWVYPVGAERDWRATDHPGSPAYALLRGFRGEIPAHRGVDLGNGSAGGAVCASGHGVVVVALDGDRESDWGNRVVIAHRLTDGSLAYSVYAHLLPGSVRVRCGETVVAGEPVARVGRTGNATTPHLHFEIRVASSAELRWENARAVDPLAFVEHRLVTAREGAASSCLAWAEEAALLGRGAQAEVPLRRVAWRAMLAAAARSDAVRIPVSPESLDACLEGAGIVEEGLRAAPHDVPSWKEIRRDLERLKRAGHRLPSVPLASDRLAEALERGLGGAADLGRLDRNHPDRPPSMGDAALLFAALAGPRPEPSAAR
jgi:murein DD-endopeptidase MepM/ murein hydrolase activator NlpD